MRIWYLSLWTPFAIAAAGVLVGLASYPKLDAGSGLFALAFAWVLFFGRARKTYWNARLRTRAALDERRSSS